ncbi:MAG: class 3 adenylate cyclase/tetratricopeptide (TPR) repeat protein [Gammaproteobacteria bacterium]|jgi:class 3 adenylate cyclase/tetratricopeptide (TPR) repeat protein
MTIREWLQQINLPQYIEIFEENAVELDVLTDITDADLVSMDVLLGHRRKILRAIADLEDSQVDPLVQMEKPTILAPVPAVEIGERRQVTVLFADLSGFTALSNQIDAEELHQLLNRYFDRVDQLIHDFGGSVDKHIGDCVMALFGAPIAHSDDSLRAVRAANAIHQEMQHLSEELDRSLSAHIGIASGEVVASHTGSAQHRQYTVTGDTVNLASRLQDLATASETMLSGEVYRAVEHLAICESKGEVAVKGFSDNIAVWKLGALSESSPSAKSVAGIVGRTIEIAQFEVFLNASQSGRCGHGLLVRGELGIGKSRLASEFRHRAEAVGLRSYASYFLDYGEGLRQGGLPRLLLGLLDIPETGDLSHDQTLSDYLISFFKQPEQCASLHDFLGLKMPTNLRGLYDAMSPVLRDSARKAAVIEVLRMQSARQGLLLLLEDMHWCSDADEEFLAHILQHIANLPIVLVMTSRTEDRVISRSWREHFPDNVLAVMDLNPLSAEDALSMAKAVASQDVALREDLVTRAEGNPLFIEQMVRFADESAQGDVPESIQALVQTRLDRLPAEDKRALQAASVFGQHFHLDALRTVVGNSAYSAAALVDHHLVKPAEQGYMFSHAMIQAGARKSLLKEDAMRLHRGVADWFKQRDHRLFAEHLELANADEAGRAWLVAARLEAASYRNDTAVEALARGLQCTTDSVTLFELHEEYARQLLVMGKPQDATAQFRAAESLASDDQKHCLVQIGLGSCARLQGDFDSGLEHLQTARTLADESAEKITRAQIHYNIGAIQFATGSIDLSLPNQQLALQFATEAKNSEWIARSMSGLGDAYYAQGRASAAKASYNASIDLAREAGLGHIEVSNMGAYANSHRFMLEMVSAYEIARKGCELSRKVGNRRAELVVTMVLGELLMDSGQAEDALEHLEYAHKIATDLHNVPWQCYMEAGIGRCRAQLGDLDRAQNILLHALEKSRQGNHGFIGPRLCGVLALISQKVGSMKSYIVEAEDLLGKGCAAHNHFVFRRDAMEAAYQLGSYDIAKEQIDRFEKFLPQDPVLWCNFFIDRMRCLLAAVEGQPDSNVINNLIQQARVTKLWLAIPALEAIR